MRCVAPSSDPAYPGVVDRLVRCPVGVESVFSTSMGASALTTSRHLPLPVPSPPLTPVPDSSAFAPSVRVAPASSVSTTAPPGDRPASSMPSMRTSVRSAPGLTSRSRLTWFSFLPGLNIATRCCPDSVRATTSCMLVRNPSEVRM